MAFDLAREARPVINPNPGFCMQLVKFYKNLHPDRPAPGLGEEKEEEEGGRDASSSLVGDVDSLVALHAKSGSKASLLHRDEEMVMFHEKFGVCKNHITIVPTKTIHGIQSLKQEDIPLLEAQYAMGMSELGRRTKEILAFKTIPEEEIPSVVVAGFFHPSSLEQLQLHMLLPPFRTERVCAHPKWHPYEKVIRDLNEHQKVLSFDEHPDPEEGERLQSAAVALHRRFKELEKESTPPATQVAERRGDAIPEPE